MNYSELHPLLSTLGHPEIHTRTPGPPAADAHHESYFTNRIVSPRSHFSFLFNLTVETTCSETQTVEGSWDVWAPSVFQATRRVLIQPSHTGGIGQNNGLERFFKDFFQFFL